MNGIQHTSITVDERPHCCAICDKPIKPGFLMCIGHWRMVPADLARRVLSTWGTYTRAPRRFQPRERDAYVKARDAAIASVNHQLAPESGAEGQS